MALVLVTAPAAEPVTLTEAKAHLRVDVSSDDTLITSLIVAAREHVESYTGRALISQTWDLFLDGFPDCEIELPRARVQSITSVTYTDANGDAQTWAAAKYQADSKSEPARLKPAYGESYPSTRADTFNTVTVRFVAGYGDDAADVPQLIKNGMLFLIAHLYENREAVMGTSFQGFLAEAPLGVKALLYPFKVFYRGTL